MKQKFITHEEFALKLNGKEYGNEITKELKKEAFENGLVVVFGASDDLIEFEGSISDELGAGDNDSFKIKLKSLKVKNSENGKNIIKSFWANKELGTSWNYETEIPHSKFNIYEDGDLYCIGIVFSIFDLK